MGKIPLQIGDKGGTIDKSITSELEFTLHCGSQRRNHKISVLELDETTNLG